MSLRPQAPCAGGDHPEERSQTHRLVAEAVAELPADEREAIVLRHYVGLTFPRIAEIVDAPVTTIKSRVLRALEKLTARLSDRDATT